MAGMRFSWQLTGDGWVDFTVADDHTEATGTASCITPAPNDFLTAVFLHSGDDVHVQLMQLPESRSADSAGTEIWSSSQTIAALARTIIRAFDDVTRTHSDSSYLDSWRTSFPRTELVNLRRAWRQAPRANGTKSKIV